MKIISGKYKGRALEGFELKGTRPTMDRVKESLFATIQEYIPNSVVLDLFSGSGNLGIESLSEGASYAYLIDSNYKATNVIKRNIDKIKIENAEVWNMDYKKALYELKKQNKKINIIFLDPPYKTDYIEESLKLIKEYELLETNGIIVCESDNLNKIVYSNNFISKKEKKYGDKYIVLLQKI